MIPNNIARPLKIGPAGNHRVVLWPVRALSRPGDLNAAIFSMAVTMPECPVAFALSSAT